MHEDDILQQSVLDVGFDYKVTHLKLSRLIPGKHIFYSMYECGISLSGIV
jgi:hypothetical protein